MKHQNIYIQFLCYIFTIIKLHLIIIYKKAANRYINSTFLLVRHFSFSTLLYLWYIEKTLSSIKETILSCSARNTDDIFSE